MKNKYDARPSPEAQEALTGERIKPEPVRIQGMLLKADTPSANGHIYPQAVLEKALADAQVKVQQGVFLGTFGEGTLTLSLTNVSHLVRDLSIQGDEVHAEVELLPTPKGNAILEYLKKGGDVRLVPSGKGRTEDDGTVTDFTLVSVDIVPNDY